MLGPRNRIVGHRLALPHCDLAAAIETVRGSNAPATVKLAFDFLVLTAARYGEVGGSPW